jgi:hypothetical protein
MSPNSAATPPPRLAQAIKIRAGTCSFPTCTVPADRCDIDHHQPVPRGPTAGWNTDPFCRRHHRGKTFAWLAALRDHDGLDWTMHTAEPTDASTNHYPQDLDRHDSRLSGLTADDYGAAPSTTLVKLLVCGGTVRRGP